MSTAKKIWLIAGESSGDLYGARLAEDLRRLYPQVELSGMGGIKMRKAGVNLLVDSTELGVVGIVEVLGCIVKIIKIMLFLLKKAAEERPDAVVLIDYPGFNIRFAKRLKKLGIPVIWYISPQVWVWRKSNIKRLAAYCTKMMVIFPFEVEVYNGSGLDVEFVGHPLVEIVDERKDPALQRDPDQIILLPGSRHSEIKRLLQPILETAALLKKKHPDYKFVLPAPREKVANDVQNGLASFLLKHPELNAADFRVALGETASLMQTGIAGIAASGTVTVECALSELPLVVGYKLNWFTLLFAAVVIRKLYRNAFTMPNIILNRTLFEEFLQWRFSPKAAFEAMERILPGGSRHDEVRAGMKEMKKELTGVAGSPCENAAHCVLKVIGAE